MGDPDNGISPGTSFENLPDDWICPVCGAPKDQFEKINSELLTSHPLRHHLLRSKNNVKSACSAP